VDTLERLGQALDKAFDCQAFDLRVSVARGPSLSLLRNQDAAWLMYLRKPGDSGLRSSGDTTRTGSARFRLDNGQSDEYPLAWCVEIDRALKAVSCFCVNDGARPDGVDWVES
jgi:hypothetical protein